MQMWTRPRPGDIEVGEGGEHIGSRESPETDHRAVRRRACAVWTVVRSQYCVCSACAHVETRETAQRQRAETESVVCLCDFDV